MPGVAITRPPWAFEMTRVMANLPPHIGKEILKAVLDVPEEQRIGLIEVWADAFGPMDRGFAPAGPDTIGGLVDALEAKR